MPKASSGPLVDNPALERRALIAHYSGIRHRPDFAGGPRQHDAGGWYFHIPGQTPTAYGHVQ